MAKTPLPEGLSLFLELSQFFKVKDENRKIELEEYENFPAKTYFPNKRAQKYDFNAIYEREFKETELEDNPENRANWRGRLITDIQKKIDSHTSHTRLKDQDNQLLSKAVSFIQFLKHMDNKPEGINIDENYKNQILFKVGLLFAKGDLDKYYKLDSEGGTVIKPEYSAPRIAEELNHGNYKKFILATLNNYSPKKANGRKNIFNRGDMMTKIINHCDKEKIEVTPYFKSRLPKD